MKRFLVAITALIAALAIGLATVSTTAGAAGGDNAAQVAKKKKKKKKKVASFVSLTIVFTPADTYSPGSGTFTGAVTAGNGKCISNRTVQITRGGNVEAQTVTNAGGAYSVTNNHAPQSGPYTAFSPKKVVVKKKKNKKTGKVKKKKIICLGATSPPVTVP
jgi:hypothetical protein